MALGKALPRLGRLRKAHRWDTAAQFRPARLLRNPEPRTVEVVGELPREAAAGALALLGWVLGAQARLEFCIMYYVND